MAKLLTKREYKQRRIRFQVAAGLIEFLGTLASFFIIVGCFALLTSLFNWVRADIPSSFGDFTNLAEMALGMDQAPTAAPEMPAEN